MPNYTQIICQLYPTMWETQNPKPTICRWFMIRWLYHVTLRQFNIAIKRGHWQLMYLYENWLVVYLPLWKIWKSGVIIIPNIYIYIYNIIIYINIIYMEQ